MTNTGQRTSPTRSDLKKLFAHSGNRCAFPKCRIPVVEDGTLLGEVCHVRGANKLGARFDASQSPDERHGFDNLILLCGTHHTVIDADEDAYTVERLLKMKADHEAHASVLSDHAVREFEIVFHQSMQIGGQTGGFAAHTVHAGTINVTSAPTSPLLEQRTMQAIDTVWGVMLALENTFRAITFADSILTEDELANYFAGGDTRDPFRSLQAFATHEAVTRAMDEAGIELVEPERPYLRRRLWVLYFAYQAVLGRCGMLVAFSFQKRSFHNWRKDSGVEAHMQSVLTQEQIDFLRQQRNYGLYHVLDTLKETFLAEAERQRISLRKA